MRKLHFLQMSRTLCRNKNIHVIATTNVDEFLSSTMPRCARCEASKMIVKAKATRAAKPAPIFSDADRAELATAKWTE